MQNSTFYYNQSLISKISNETVLDSYHNVTFQENDIKVIQLALDVTTHRLIFKSQNSHAFVVDGQRIAQVCITEQGFFSKQYFLQIKTKYSEKIVIRLKNYKELHVMINGMIQKKAWTLKEEPIQKKPGMYSGLMSKIEQERSNITKNQQTVSQAFTSFDGLFGNLRDLKTIMGQMKATTNNPDGENPEVHKILKDIGFVSVVSKEEAGRDYYRQLAANIYQICENSLFKTYGGMVSLLDVFYFYNKKRQMELISPEELLKACQQFQKFKLNAKLVSYPNNIKMIESTHFDSEKDFNLHFKQYFGSYKDGYSAEQIARKKGLPLIIVEIKLKKAAQIGWLAIDDRIEGVKYYKNLIMSI